MGQLQKTVQFLCKTFKKNKKKSILKIENINVKDMNDSKKLLKTIKPFFSNKGLNSNKLMLIEDIKLISEESKIANTMNQYFTSITK